ncbi:mitochondrial 54S ribosomal protein bL27m [Limtongia smithiae]|uniref:mitochondrial 54S ribosomal protein bL27m n=1 Tax=Limtongia smithiae TaxID=1125753 RepID=UPI0034CE5C98
MSLWSDAARRLLRAGASTIAVVGKNTIVRTAQLQFVRHATKKAASSRTNDYNSVGKRLGLKVAEGAPVRVGEIIFRQRGTKWYPGENADIGKDYTIFAREPGFARYYRDPFHPNRKLIGVALAQDLRLPTPHWQPRRRRLGLVPLTDPAEIEAERTRLSRKEYYGWIKKTELYEERQAKRKAREAAPIKVSAEVKPAQAA